MSSPPFSDAILPVVPDAIPSEGSAAAQTLSRLAELTSDAVAVIEHANYQLEFLNAAGRTMLGVGASEPLAGRSLMEFIPSHCLWTLLNDAVPSALRVGRWEGEVDLRRCDGSECAVSLVLFSPRDSSGSNQERLAFVARDISVLRRTVQSLKGDQRFLRALLENLPDEIYFKDRESRYLRVSHAMATKFGVVDPEAMLGKTDADFFTAEHANAANAGEQEIIRTERSVINAEEREAWADGRVTWVSTTKLPYYNEYGQVVGTFGISRDITARKNAELALMDAQRSLLEASRLAGMAEVASGVLHNIGNAFNSVNTSAALVSDQLVASRVVNLAKVVQLFEEHAQDLPAFFSADSRGRQLPAYLAQLSRQLLNERETLLREVESLRKGVDHIKNVITMQQTYAHASSLAEDLLPAEVVEEALRISEISLSHHKIALNRRFEPTPLVRAARHKILQILVNLVRNAKHALDESGGADKRLDVTIRVAPQNRIQIVVTDNGCGISPENLRKIFAFGFTTKKSGHGFGLHSSALAAQEMEGSLTVHSDGPGRGAAFTLELPAIAPQS